MKKLLYLFLFFQSFSIFGQDSVSVEINILVIDKLQGIPIVNETIKIESVNFNYFQDFTLKSDSLGQIHFKKNFKSQLSSFPILLSGTNYYADFITIDSIGNTSLKLDFKKEFIAMKMCWDSFLPSTMYFNKNELTTIDSSFSVDYLLTSFKRLIEEYPEPIAVRKLKITASCSYDERFRVSKKRLKKVAEIALEAGFKKEDLILINKRKKSLFHCDYCDGCHYFFLKGTGTTISLKNFKNLTETTEIDRQTTLRRSVHLKWVGK